MLALRSIARALPRATFRASSLRITSKPLAIRPTSTFANRPAFKAFSTSRIWREPAGDSDLELSAKLAQERQLELDSRDPTQLPQVIEDFLNDSPFQVEDKPGTEDVVLTRKFGNETIRIEFNIADMNEAHEMDEMDEDSALADEDDYGSDATSGGKRTINQAGTRGGKVDIAPEDSIAPADRDDEFAEGESDLSSYPLNLNITIEKPGSGATNIIAQAQDGEIEILNVHFYPKAELVDPKTPEQAKESQSLYGGPEFAHLDVELQAMYETYIQERGINTQLALFLPQYVDFKEQREYVQWLENMKNFIDA